MKNNLEIAIRAAIEAGKEIIEVYSTEFDVELKGDNSPLTLADKRANEVINFHLKKTGIPIISEENKQLDYSERKNWEQCWIVDPLDGTKEFVKRNGEFTVNIALVQNGNPMLGVIYVPVSKTLYFTSAEKNKAFKTIIESGTETLDQIFKNACLILPDNDRRITKIIGSRSHLNDATREFISEEERKGEVQIVTRGSSLKFCMVAEGEAHLYPRYAPTMEWDTAAGQAICEAVGISVIDRTTNRSLRYNKENLLNPHFLVTKNQ